MVRSADLKARSNDNSGRKPKLSQVGAAAAAIIAGALIVFGMVNYFPLTRINQAAVETKSLLPLAANQQHLSLWAEKLSRMSERTLLAINNNERREALGAAEKLAADMVERSEAADRIEIESAMEAIRKAAHLGDDGDILKRDIDQRLLNADQFIKSLANSLASAIEDSGFQLEEMIEGLADSVDDIDIVGEEIIEIFTINTASNNLLATVRDMRRLLSQANNSSQAGQIAPLAKQFAILAKRSIALSDELPGTGDFEEIPEQLKILAQNQKIFSLRQQILAKSAAAGNVAALATRKLTALIGNLSQRAATAMKQSVESAEATSTDTGKVMAITFLSLGGLIFLVAVLCFAIYRRILMPLRNLTRALETLGDVSKEDKKTLAPTHMHELEEIRTAIELFKLNAVEAERLKRVAEQTAELEQQKDYEERQKQAEIKEAERKREMEEAEAREQRAQNISNMIADFERKVSGNLETVNQAASELKETADDLSETASGSRALSEAVASASNEASINVQTVAAAADQLNSSITKIGRRCNRPATSPNRR